MQKVLLIGGHSQKILNIHCLRHRPNLFPLSSDVNLPSLPGLRGYIRLHNGPPRCRVLISEYVTLHSKKAFADVIKLRILRWRDNPDCLGGSTHNNLRSPGKRKQEDLS